jgi:hypothetical protein
MARLRSPFAFALLLMLGSAAFAQAPSFTVKQIGASFAEPPPGRDKALAPMAMEKVETTIVIDFKNRLVADVPSFGGDTGVAVTALLASGGSFDLGRADIGAFKRVSEDKRKVALTLSIGRLPDQPIKGVHFAGHAKVAVASGSKTKALDFKPQVGAALDAGFGTVTLSALDSSTLSLDGGDGLNRLHGLTLVRADGSVATAERAGWSQIGAKISSQWRFQGPVTAGRLEFLYYDNLETLSVPVDLLVAKPY